MVTNYAMTETKKGAIVSNGIVHDTLVEKLKMINYRSKYLNN